MQNKTKKQTKQEHWLGYDNTYHQKTKVNLVTNATREVEHPENPPYTAPLHVLYYVTSHELPECQEINFRLSDGPSEMT